MNADGSEQRRLTENALAFYPDWSPNSEEKLQTQKIVIIVVRRGESPQGLILILQCLQEDLFWPWSGFCLRVPKT